MRGRRGGALAGRRRLARLVVESPGQHDDKANGEKGANCPGRWKPAQVDPTTLDELRQGFFGWSEARLVFVDEELCVESEVVRICAQEPPDVSIAGKEVEALILERLEIPGANVRIGVDLDELDPVANPCLAEAASNLEHPYTSSTDFGAHYR
jgi:hypothetical protein